MSAADDYANAQMGGQAVAFCLLGGIATIAFGMWAAPAIAGFLGLQGVIGFAAAAGLGTTGLVGTGYAALKGAEYALESDENRKNVFAPKKLISGAMIPLALGAAAAGYGYYNPPLELRQPALTESKAAPSFQSACEGVVVDRASNTVYIPDNCGVVRNSPTAGQ